MLLGIDLGTTNSLVAIYDPKRGESIELCDLVPSVVNFETKAAGISEKERLLSDESARILGSFKVNMSLDQSGLIAREASALVLKEIKKYTQGKPCVISVPAYFTDSQRKATHESAKAAGIEVPHLVNEPTAAALYYNRNKKTVTAVYDLGGGTFDISIVDNRFGMNDVLATDGMKLGGDDMNKAIRDRIYADCKVRKHKLNDVIERRFIEFSEKIKLTVQKEGFAKLEFSEYADVFEKTVFVLDEEQYSSMVKAVFGVTVVLAHTVIKNAGFVPGDIELILVGGSTRDPYLCRMISETMNPEALTYDPDRIVAQGTAYYAYLVHQGMNITAVSDVTKAIGIEMEGDIMQFVIQPNSKIPISESCMVFNSQDTDKLIVNVLQGNSSVASQNDKIGTLEYLYSVFKPKGEGRVKVTIAADADGTIAVSVKEALKNEVTVTLCYQK
jgi:molecular chaperone DnaK (HSP70)